MGASDQRLLAALLRNSLYSFARKAFATVSPGEPFFANWHLEALCHHLELVRLGQIRRLKIEVPPRSLKSVCASVAFPAFILGHDPGAKIITVSYLICPLLSGPISILELVTKEEWNGEEAQAGRDHRQAA